MKIIPHKNVSPHNKVIPHPKGTLILGKDFQRILRNTQLFLTFPENTERDESGIEKGLFCGALEGVGGER